MSGTTKTTKRLRTAYSSINVQPYCTYTDASTLNSAGRHQAVLNSHVATFLLDSKLFSFQTIEKKVNLSCSAAEHINNMYREFVQLVGAGLWPLLAHRCIPYVQQHLLCAIKPISGCTFAMFLLNAWLIALKQQSATYRGEQPPLLSSTPSNLVNVEFRVYVIEEKSIILIIFGLFFCTLERNVTSLACYAEGRGFDPDHDACTLSPWSY